MIQETSATISRSGNRPGASDTALAFLNNFRLAHGRRVTGWRAPCRSTAEVRRTVLLEESELDGIGHCLIAGIVRVKMIFRGKTG